MQTRSNASKLPFQNLTPPYLESPSKKNAPKTTGTGKQIGKCIKAQMLTLTPHLLTGLTDEQIK